jgi:pyruvate kinase
MSRISSGIPIYALTAHEKTCRRVTIFRGVYPVSFNPTGIHDHAVLNRAILDEFLNRRLVQGDDRLILTKGDLMGTQGGTNAMKIASVDEILAAAPEDWKAQCPDCNQS